MDKVIIDIIEYMPSLSASLIVDAFASHHAVLNKDFLQKAISTLQHIESTPEEFYLSPSAELFEELCIRFSELLRKEEEIKRRIGWFYNVVVILARNTFNYSPETKKSITVARGVCEQILGGVQR